MGTRQGQWAGARGGAGQGSHSPDDTQAQGSGGAAAERASKRAARRGARALGERPHFQFHAGSPRREVAHSRLRKGSLRVSGVSCPLLDPSGCPCRPSTLSKGESTPGFTPSPDGRRGNTSSQVPPKLREKDGPFLEGRWRRRGAGGEGEAQPSPCRKRVPRDKEQGAGWGRGSQRCRKLFIEGEGGACGEKPPGLTHGEGHSVIGPEREGLGLGKSTPTALGSPPEAGKLQVGLGREGFPGRALGGRSPEMEAWDEARNSRAGKPEERGSL